MSLFKNPNESGYIGGRKHWSDVIKNSSPVTCMLYRCPEEDFNTNSTLIVLPREEAVFVKDGKVEEVFTQGRYKLSTQNYPFISRLRNLFSGGVSIFNCIVFFIRKAHSFELKWGTESPILARDKKLGVMTSLRARGSYKVVVDNSIVFIENLCTSQVNIALQSDIDRFFVLQFQSLIKILFQIMWQKWTMN